MQQNVYDVVVIGAGSGGLTAAVGFNKIGKSVLLVERAHMGGECTNSGCVPSKALLHHAKAYHHAQTIAGKNTATETFRAEAFSYVRQTIQAILDEEQPTTFTDMGIDVVRGDAHFTGPCTIAVDDTEYRFGHAVIATGSSPRPLEVPGLDPADVLTNQNLFELSDAPDRTLVIGSGPIGMEMGQALAMLGSNVTVASIDNVFARLEDPSIRPILERTFTELGVTIELNAHLKAVEAGEAVFDRIVDSTTTEEFRISFSKVLVAIGRVPNLPSGLDTAGIAYDTRCIMVDSQHRTSNKYVYAIGDVTQRLKFTHTADDIARQVVARVASRGLVRVNKNRAVPKVTYTQPEVAQVGLSWDAATEKYKEAALMRIEVPFTKSDRAKTDGTTEAGYLVVIVRRLTGTILGAHLIGPAAGELISIFTLAIDEKVSLWRLRRLIYAYPTYALVIKKAGDQFFARQLAELRPDLTRVISAHAPKLIALLFWGILLYWFHDYRVSNDLSYQAILFQLLGFFTDTIYGPLVYMVLYAVRPLIFFPATLLTALSGALFGFWWGILYTIIGENASANFAYVIGRYFGKDLRLEDTVIGNWVQALRKNSFEAVLLMRLFYVPFDLTNYGSGVVGARWREYFLATFIGIMPGLTTFVALGAALDLEKFQATGLTFDAFNPWFLALSVVIFVVSLVLSRYLKRWRATTE